MKNILTKTTPIVLALIVASSTLAQAQDSELEQVKAAMKAMQKQMEEMQKKIADLEREKQEKEKAAAAAPTPPAPSKVAENSPSVQAVEKVAAGGDIGTQSPVADRHALNDQQEAAPRSKDMTLDPKYRGFIPVPNTPVLVKFNAKPRVDITSDSRNAGNPDRFATATIPVQGEADYGGSEQFNVNARGSSLSVDVRAPEIAGSPRFYYDNDFFGSGSGMSYRVKHLYGSIYNVTAGFTYSCFEDPDAWPDTVDFEGPNSVIFARRALVRYMLPFSDEWQMNFGCEAPGSEIDTSTTADALNTSSRLPDATMNVRWENAKAGHVQLGGVIRDIGAKGPTVGDEHVIGWGFNLATSLNVFDRDSVQAQFTYGRGIFRYMNDDFINNDAAFDGGGNLEAIPCFGATVGYTHHWSEKFRSTATYGYLDLDPLTTQGGFAYDHTHYASVNIVWQLRERLSVGLEALYGKKEAQNDSTGDVWRIQLGLVYKLF